jgi:hypothetical protein
MFTYKASKTFGDVRIAAESVAPPFDLAARADQDLLKEFVLLLTRQNLETLDERQTGVDHDRELAREDRELLGLHAAAELGHVEFLALLGHFGGSDLLALQQVRQFRLIGCGHDTADAGAGAAGSLIFVIRHVYVLLSPSIVPACGRFETKIH